MHLFDSSLLAVQTSPPRLVSNKYLVAIWPFWVFWMVSLASLYSPMNIECVYHHCPMPVISNKNYLWRSLSWSPRFRSGSRFALDRNPKHLFHIIRHRVHLEMKCSFFLLIKIKSSPFLSFHLHFSVYQWWRAFLSYFPLSPLTDLMIQ